MSSDVGFARTWSAEILKAAPLIAPARQYVWPMRIAGEEDALARGALLLMVRPAGVGQYLVTCALGFRDPSMPTGVFGCPDADAICAVAGGYAYVASANAPERCVQVGMKPVVEVHPAVAAGLLLFVGFHTIQAWGRDGVVWETGRLSWEGFGGDVAYFTERRGGRVPSGICGGCGGGVSGGFADGRAFSGGGFRV